jgi:hypothetical protein
MQIIFPHSSMSLFNCSHSLGRLHIYLIYSVPHGVSFYEVISRSQCELTVAWSWLVRDNDAVFFVHRSTNDQKFHKADITRSSPSCSVMIGAFDDFGTLH